MAVVNNWGTHDFAVKMLDWCAVRGSTLEYRCRRCGRNFHQFTAVSRGIRAVDGESLALDRLVSDRWLSDECPRLLTAKDDEDRKQLSNVPA